MKSRLYKVLAGVLSMALLAGAAAAQVSSGFDLHWAILSGGGGARTSASYQLDDVLGQWVVGASASSNYQVKSGFWVEAMIPTASYAIYLPLVTRR